MSDGWQALAFGVCGATTVVVQVAFFLVAFTLGIDKVTDLAGCANFILLALLTLLVEPENNTTRQLVTTALVCASRLQLGAYLFYRVLKRGHDARFDELRARCLPFLAGRGCCEGEPAAPVPVPVPVPVPAPEPVEYLYDCERWPCLILSLLVLTPPSPHPQSALRRRASPTASATSRPARRRAPLCSH